MKESTIFTDVSIRQFLAVLVIGAMSGTLMYGLSLFLEATVFKTLVCQGQVCAAGEQYSTVFAQLVTAGIVLFIFVKLQVFRPLLVVIATTASLWNVVLLVNAQYPYLALTICAGLYMICYGVFVWLARIKLFWLMLFIFAVLTVAIRLML